MATSPDVVRRALTRVTGAAVREMRSVSAAAAKSPADWRGAIFEAAPLIVAEYAPGASSLSLDWFDEIRTDAKATSDYSPTPRLNVTDDEVAAMVARVTETAHEIDLRISEETDRLIAEMTAVLEGEIQQEVATGFWDTITENADEDPDAKGWQRFARGGACKFCQMIAGRGAVFTRTSVNFASHRGCHCVVGPSYDATAPRASVEQYLGSKKRRSTKERADLRAYLNKNYPDAPG